MATTFFTAVLSFVSTNIDDIFVLMILYAQVLDSKGVIQIIAGQYFGIGCLCALGTLGALGTQIILPQYVGLLGFLPLLLGIRSWRDCRCRQDKSETETQNKTQINFFSVTLLTIANGADNIGVYVPLFSGYTHADFMITLSVFAVMIALWCYLGFRLASYPYIKKKITHYQHILVPLVLIALGISILAKNYLF